MTHAEYRKIIEKIKQILKNVEAKVSVSVSIDTTNGFSAYFKKDELESYVTIRVSDHRTGLVRKSEEHQFDFLDGIEDISKSILSILKGDILYIKSLEKEKNKISDFLRLTAKKLLKNKEIPLRIIEKKEICKHFLYHSLVSFYRKKSSDFVKKTNFEKSYRFEMFLFEKQEFINFLENEY